MQNPALVLDFATRLVYSVKGLPIAQKTQWGQLTGIQFSNALEESEIRYTESRAAIEKVKLELQTYVQPLGEADFIESLALVESLRRLATGSGDLLVAKRLKEKIKEALRVSQYPEVASQINSRAQEIHSSLEHYDRRSVIEIPLQIWPIGMDFFLRCATLFFYERYQPDVGAGLIFINLLGIPTLIFILILFLSIRDKKRNQNLLKEYEGIERLRVVFKISSFQYTCLAFFLGSSLWITYLLYADEPNIALTTVYLMIGLGLYYTICLRYFRIGKLDENTLASQIENFESRPGALSVDENDEQIINIETRLNSITSRLEAYVLESALFGALSFSGFLQVIANNIISVNDMKSFADEWIITAQALVHADLKGFESGLASLDTNASLFCLVSVESLLCSILFLAVIASRLQFSDVADKVRESINLAKAYNDKEDALAEKDIRTPANDDRLRQLNEKINDLLSKAVQTSRELAPVVEYMKYFRNAGILVFLIILVTSSLFITGTLAWALGVLGIATIFYFNRKSIIHYGSASYILIRVQFISRGKVFLIATSALIVLAFGARITMQSEESDWLLMLAFVLLGAYGCIWIIFSPHYDPAFGEIGNKSSVLDESRWGITKNVFGGTVMLASLGLSLKILSVTGANEILMLSLMPLAFIVYIMGYYLSKKRWLGVVLGLPLACTFMGTLFRILHLNGSESMLILSLVFNICFFLVLFFKRNLFHKLLIQIYVVLLMISGYMYFGGRIGVAYDEGSFSDKFFEARMNMSPLTHEYDEIMDSRMTLLDKTKLCRQGIADFDAKYLGLHPHRIQARPFILRERIDIYLVKEIVDSLNAHHNVQKDSLVLKNTLQIAGHIIQTESKYEFRGPELESRDLALESDVLLLMNDRTAAIRSLENVLAMKPPPQFSGFLEDRLENLKTQ